MCVAAATALVLAGTASAAGGNYVFDGGTAYQQQQVRQALAASSFNWSVIPGTITIHITPDFTSESIPGAIFLDPDLLDSGEFAWGVVQHEYAHQVDFALFDDATHAALTTQLGASAWCYGNTPTLLHSEYGCERSPRRLGLLAVARDACNRQVAGGESGAMAPAAFRALMTRLLGVDPPRRMYAGATRPGSDVRPFEHRSRERVGA